MDRSRTGTTQNKTPLTSTASPSDTAQPGVDHDVSTGQMQEGVKQVEALTMSWTRTSLAIAYALYVSQPIHLL